MLIKCPECELQISDKAAFCPHCGYVLNNKKIYMPNRTSSKRKRLPNGFGQIHKINNKNLRKPYRAIVTVGKNGNGAFIQRLLKPQAYFKTYNEAYEALLEYNRSPYDLITSEMSVMELYEKWFDEYRKTLKSNSSERTIISAWRYCSTLYDLPVKSLRARHIKGVINDGFIVENGKNKEASPNTKSRIKSIFNLMLDYALEYELVDKNYARTFNISDDIIDETEKVRRGHLAFTDSELKTLWDNIHVEKSYIDVLLYQCYSGWRPQELGLLRTENVDFNKWEITGGMKTDAGTNRIVPIHPKVRDIVVNRYKEARDLNSEYLFNCTDGSTHRTNIKMTYDKYSYRFKKIVGALNLNPKHRAHDGRKTFITLCKNANVDEYAIKYIVGHSINDITEAIYTERDPGWLHDEISKIE